MCSQKKRQFKEIKWQSLPIIVLSLLVLPKKEVVAVCVQADHEELLQYNCEGGSLEDLKAVPDNVEKIRVTNMRVEQLGETILSRFNNSLLVLTCSNCLIKEISDGAFSRLRNLQQLSLDNNQLTKVHASWFEPGLDFLTYLDLNYNQIKSLDTDLFRMVPSLVDLRLSGNQLECLNIQALSLLHDLKRIFLNENPNFGCPNALGNYLKARGIDYEPDPQWANQFHDRLSTDELSSLVDPASNMATTTMQSPSTLILLTSSTPFETSGLSHTFSPSKELDFNGSVYYKTTVISQKLNNYRNPQNLSSHSTQSLSSSVITRTSLPTEPATTECPNSTTFIGPLSYLVLMIIVTALGFSSYI